MYAGVDTTGKKRHKKERKEKRKRIASGTNRQK